MRLAFLTGALAAALAAAVLAALVIWVAGTLTGADGAWTWAALLVAVVGTVFGVATYLAERVVHRRTMARMRSIGEPWAFRDDQHGAGR